MRTIRRDARTYRRGARRVRVQRWPQRRSCGRCDRSQGRRLSQPWRCRPMIDRHELFTALQAAQPASGAPAPDVLSVPAKVQAWLARGPQRFEGDDRGDLEALCRQIDVRKKVSTTYSPGWKRLDPETPVPAVVMAGLVAVLLGNAGRLGEPGDGNTLNDGWGLKCV